MSGAYSRYAIYAAPGGELAAFGAAWLGWDMETGRAVHDAARHARLPGLEAATERPRKYGFHGTLKAPFRLARGQSLASLQAALADYARTAAPARTGPLEVARLGSFLALRPTGDTAALGAQAFDIVQRFDDFRAPLSSADLARRRAAGLTQAQDDLLTRWGYPFVGPEFRFHLTLSGPLQGEAADPLRAELARELAPMLTGPFALDRIALTGERRADGRFELIEAYGLTG